MPKSKGAITAAGFINALARNVDNKTMPDSEFRDFIRKKLPKITYADQSIGIPSHQVSCQYCRKLGETTCGNDTRNLICFEGGQE